MFTARPFTAQFGGYVHCAAVGGRLTHTHASSPFLHVKRRLLCQMGFSAKAWRHFLPKNWIENRIVREVRCSGTEVPLYKILQWTIASHPQGWGFGSSPQFCACGIFSLCWREFLPIGRKHTVRLGGGSCMSTCVSLHPVGVWHPGQRPPQPACVSWLITACTG